MSIVPSERNSSGEVSPQEIRRVYAERVSSTNKFAIGGLSIILVLAVFLEERIRERRDNVYLYENQLRVCEERIEAGPKNLSRLHHRFYMNLLYEDETVFSSYFEANLKKLNLPLPPSETEGPFKLLDESEQDFLADNSVPYLPVEERRIAKTKGIEAELANLPKVSDWNEVLKENPPLAAMVSENKNDYYSKKSYVKGHVRRYLNQYRVYLDARRVRLLLEERIADQINQRESIPSPFGKFLVRPELALIMLALFNLAAFFKFQIDAYRVHYLRSIYHEVTSGDSSSDLYRVPKAPFWVYPLPAALTGQDRRGFRSFFQHSLSRAFTMFWLVFSSALVFECTRYNVSDNLNLASPLFVNIVLYGALFAVVPITLDRLTRPGYVIGTDGLRYIYHGIGKCNQYVVQRAKTRPIVSRREFFVTSMVVIAAAVIPVVVRYSRRGISHADLKLKYDSLLKQAYAAEDDIDRERLFSSALALQPHQMRPLDGLMKTYGRQKRYDKIQERVDYVRGFIQLRLIDMPEKERRYSIASRLLEERQSRIDRIRSEKESRN